MRDENLYKVELCSVNKLIELLNIYQTIQTCTHPLHK